MYPLLSLLKIASVTRSLQKAGPGLENSDLLYCQQAHLHWDGWDLRASPVTKLIAGVAVVVGVIGSIAVEEFLGASLSDVLQ